VQYKDDLNASVWMPLGANLTPTGLLLAVSDTIGDRSQRFYRIVLLP
jgi:hypothetical protein